MVDNGLVFGDPAKGQNPGVTYLDTKGKGFIEVTSSGNAYVTKLFEKTKLSDNEIEDYYILAKLEYRHKNSLYTHPEDFEKMDTPPKIDTRQSLRRLFEAGHIEMIQ